MLCAAAAAFKAGKIQNNPFSQASTSAGAAIPPPANLAGRFFKFFGIVCCIVHAQLSAIL